MLKNLPTNIHIRLFRAPISYYKQIAGFCAKVLCGSFLVLSSHAHVTLTTPAAANSAVNLGTISIKEAVLLAMRNNPTLLSSELDRVNTKFSVLIAYHQFDPIWSLSGNVAQAQSNSAGFHSSSRSLSLSPSVALNTMEGTNIQASMTNPAAVNYNPQLTVSVTQPLLQGFNTDVIMDNLLSSLNQEKLSRLNFRNSVMSTIVRVVQDYRSIINAKQSLKTQQINYQDTLLNIKSNELQIKVGNMSIAENNQAKAALPSQQYSIVSAQNAITQAKLALLQDLGLAPDVQFDVDETIQIPPFTLPTIEQVYTMALKNDVTYNSDVLNRRQLERALIKAKDAMRWQVNLAASAGVGGGSGGGPNAGMTSLFNGLNNQTQVGLNLTVPLDGLTLKQAVISAKISLQQNIISIHNDAFNVKSNVINQYISIQNQKKQLTFAEQTVQMDQLVLEQTQKKQTFGQSSQFEVNQNRNTLLRDQINLLNSEITYLNSITQFRNLVGTTLDDWHLKIRY